MLGSIGFMAWISCFPPKIRVRICFYNFNPQRHFLARNHVFWHMNGQNWCRVWPVQVSKNHKKTYELKRDILWQCWVLLGGVQVTLKAKNLQGSCRSQRNHWCKSASWSEVGVMVSGHPEIRIFRPNGWWPLQQFCTTVQTVIKAYWIG